MKISMQSSYHYSLRSPYGLLKRLLAKNIIENSFILKGRVLDLGCGNGPYRQYINCNQYIGLEMVKYENISVIGRGDYLPFGNKTFDSIIATEVLEHIADYNQCITEINRVLKNNGIVYITAPMNWPLHYEPYDFIRFTKYGLQHYLGKAGFKIIGIQRIGGPFVLMSTHLCHYLFYTIVKMLKFLGEKNAERLGSLIVLLINCIFNLLKIFDRYNDDMAVCWGAIAKKPAKNNG